ncbi:MAG: putative methyltransferase [Segetibacter sp.]|nr:putative methyltransferase [Segetibacter sp.]
MNSDIISYYKDRAKEYETIYSKPERQGDLLLAAQLLQDIFTGKSVFEIACGTGYWTEIISKTAHSILATDINDTVIEVAKSKSYYPASVRFQIADIFAIHDLNKQESLFGGFIWSHTHLQDLNSFIAIANSHVKIGGTVVFIDNNYVEGSNLPVTETDNFGNTYQTRTLENGTVHKVIKNFPSESFIRQLLVDKVSDLNFINLQYYWILMYKVK